MKLSKEEKCDSELVNKKFKFFDLRFLFINSINHNKRKFSFNKNVYVCLIVFLLCTQIVNAQIPINGFCKYTSFDVQPNYTSLFSLNFNKDSYTDLMLFSDSSKNINSIKGFANEKFQSRLKFNFIEQISKIIPVTDKYYNIIEYAFISKEKKIFGLIEFNSLGAINLKNSIKLSFTPDNLSSADIDNDGQNEFLISGAAYDGFTIITKKGLRLIKNDFEKKHIYTKSIFVDLNNDGFDDIAAFDVQYNQLKFFYNKGNGEFYFVRSFQLNHSISSLHSFDFNLDRYDDIIFTFENYIYVLYSDSIASFNNQIIIKTKYNIDKIVLRDFNKDGKIDISYLNKKNSAVSVLFQRIENNFYDEINYLKKENLTDIIPFSSRFVDGLMALSRNGKVYFISTLSYLGNYSKIAFGDEPATITHFDFNYDGMTDIAYVDKLSKALKLIIRNQNGIPSLYYSFFVYDNFSKIIPFNKKNNSSSVNITSRFGGFLLYNYNDNKFLMLEYDFLKNKFNRQYFYLEGALKDIKIVEEQNSVNPKIYLTFIKNNNLNLSTYTFRNNKYEISNINNIENNVLDSKFIDEYNLFYWKISTQTKQQNELELYSVNLQSGIIKNKIHSLTTDNNFTIQSFVFDIFNSETPTLITFYKDEKDNFVLLSNNSSNEKNYFVKKYNLNNNDFMDKIISDEKSFLNLQQLFFGEFRPQNLKKLFLYLPFNNSISTLTFLRNRNRIIVREITKAENLISFFIRRMSANNFYIVYSDKKENCIILKRL